nr:MFS transporter [Leekyejoonella antrihumi]
MTIGSTAGGLPHGPAGYRRGDAGYRRITTALFAAGMTTFVAMYAEQAVLPELTTQFSVSPATSALAVSATTGLLALAIIPASVLSERFGRVRVMATSGLIAALLGLVIPLAQTMGVLIVLRALQGAALAGVPATAMAYLAEEVHGSDLGAAMGRYIAGTTIGGLAGRLLTSFAVDLTSWRWSLELAAVVSLLFTAAFLRAAPPSIYFRPQRIGLRSTWSHLLEHVRQPGLLALFGTGFLLMGGFVSFYNIIAFRLLAKPFSLPQSVIGLVFLMYLSGTLSSALAGRLADRLGRQRVLLGVEIVSWTGLIITLPANLPCVLVGMLLFTAGFFAAHAVASGWVGLLADRHRAEASSLYLFAYYVGSSVAGAIVGLAFSAAGWTGTVLFIGALYLAAIVVAGVIPVLARRDGSRPTVQVEPAHL